MPRWYTPLTTQWADERAAGTRSPKVLRRLASHRSLRVRETVVHNKCATPQVVVAGLAAGLSTDTRLTLSRTLRHWAYEPVLAALAGDPEPAVRQNVATAAGTQAGAVVNDLLVGDGDAKVREQLASHTADVDTWERLLVDVEVDVRVAALKNARLRTPAAGIALRLAIDPDRRVAHLVWRKRLPWGVPVTEFQPSVAAAFTAGREVLAELAAATSNPDVFEALCETWTGSIKTLLEAVKDVVPA